MKYLFFIAFLISIGCTSVAQESAQTYQKAIDIIERSSEFKSLNIDRFSLSKESISFTNSAYAFWLEDPDLKFTSYDFSTYIGDFYQPIEIKAFASLREKRRAKHIFFVSETNENHFIIELLSFKRKRGPKYPKFYQGTSFSFLFKKQDDGSVKYLRTIKIVNQ